MDPWANDVIPARQASGQPADAVAYAVAGGRHGLHLEGMTSYPRQSMRIYRKNNPVKFHPDPIWNDGALGLVKRTPNKKKKKKKNNNKMNSDRSIPDLTSVWRTDGQTDSQTDGFIMANTVLCMASYADAQ